MGDDNSAELLAACEGLLAAVVRCEEAIDFDALPPELRAEWDAAYNAAALAVSRAKGGES